MRFVTVPVMLQIIKQLHARYQSSSLFLTISREIIATQANPLSARQSVPFKWLFLLSLLIGVVAVSTFWTVLPLTPTTFDFVFVSAALAIPWLPLQVYALVRHGKLGWWLSISLPMIAYWPLVLYLLVRACHHNLNACI